MRTVLVHVLQEDIDAAVAYSVKYGSGGPMDICCKCILATALQRQLNDPKLRCSFSDVYGGLGHSRHICDLPAEARAVTNIHCSLWGSVKPFTFTIELEDSYAIQI